jgi:hypothetical protein
MMGWIILGLVTLVIVIGLVVIFSNSSLSIIGGLF